MSDTAPRPAPAGARKAAKPRKATRKYPDMSALSHGERQLVLALSAAIVSARRALAAAVPAQPSNADQPADE